MRLNPEYQKKLDELEKATKKTRSDIVRRGIDIQYEIIKTTEQKEK